MKRRFLNTVKAIAVFNCMLICTQQIIAQQPRQVPAAYPSGTPVNYIRTWDAVAPEVNLNNYVHRQTKDVRMTTQYFDGLGRPLQTVVKEGSMATGSPANDLVSPIEYDEFGRIKHKYLPFAANSTGGYPTNDGNFKMNPFQQQETFMNAQFGTQNETFFYGKAVFEASPLNRILDNYAPGNNWVGSESNSNPTTRRKISSMHTFNTSTDAVRVWNVSVGTADVNLQVSVTNNGNGNQTAVYSWNTLPSTANATSLLYRTVGTSTWISNSTASPIGPRSIVIPVGNYEYALEIFTTGLPSTIVLEASNTNNINIASYGSNTAYVAGQLYKEITIDENGKQTIEFINKQGQTILKKVQLTASADDGSGSGYTGWLCTYYIYDDFGNVRCVLQPEAIKTMVNASSWTLTPTILSEQSFRYEYDPSNRVIVKKSPGIAEVYFVYDIRGRLVMTQDGNIRQGTTKWLITKYDELNRAIETGLWSNSSSLSIHLAAAATSNNYPATNTGYELLTLIHYDDYDNLPSSLSSNYVNTWNSNFSPTSTTQWPYPQMPVKSNTVIGLPTWMQIKVLGTSNTYLYNTTLYGKNGEPIQTQSTNITGGVDVTTTQYGWAGQKLVVVQKQEKQGSNQQTHVVISRVTYDDLGRMLEIKKTINSVIGSTAVNKAEQLIVSNQYNEFGQLKNKKLAPTFGSNGLENLSYDYNIRGWMLGMNRDYIKDINNNNFFGFDLGYNKNGVLGTYTAQYNGNVSGTIWKSKGDGEKRKYDFNYDASNRLLTANFNQYVSGSGASAIFDKSAQVDFSIVMGDGDPSHNYAYDDNGNILQMKQWGLKINQSSSIDNLTYTYQTGSNKLQQVVDANNDNSSKLGDFKYDPTTKTSTDYTYDANGNMITDGNKKILNIQYNHLNLPEIITVEKPSNWPPVGTGRSITYTYDALGNKLKKEVSEVSGLGSNRSIITTYINGFVYDTKLTNAGGSPEPDDHTDILQFIPHEEGRIRFKAQQVIAGNTIAAHFEYDYMIQDNLGSIRMILTEEQQQDVYPATTLEDATYNNGTAVSIEGQYYTIDQTKIVNKSAATGITDYQNNNGNPPGSPPYNNNPYSNTSANSAKLYQLNSNANKTGLGITLKVMAGDRLDVFGKSYYFTNTNGTSGNSILPVLDLLTTFLNAPTAAATTSIHGQVTATQINTTGGTAAINSMVNQQNNQSNSYPNKPRAFINIIFFDEQFKAVDYRVSMVGDNSSVKDHFSDLQNMAVPKNGFAYIYCSNESPVNVFFDNVQVIHTRGPIVEETHYYPFGLTMAGISTKAAGVITNRHKYNGKEEQREEFNDGSGLELLDFDARMYNAQIGRWNSSDPLTDDMQEWSPYNYVFNNPVMLTDPTGMSPDIVGADGLTSKQWVEASRPGADPELAGTNRDQNRQDEKKLNQAKENARKLTAIAMGEGDHGRTFTNEELILIASVYINRLRTNHSLEASFVYHDRKKNNWNGKNYRMYMYALGSSSYAHNKEAKKLADANGGKIAKAKEVYATVFRALTDESYTNAVLSNSNIQTQGFHGDINKYWDNFWNRMGWYVWAVSSGLAPNNGTVIKILGNDATHSNATFLIDDKAALKWLTNWGGGGTKYLDLFRAPKYNPVSNSYIYTMVPLLVAY